jgi:hypothetical protein
MNKMNQQEALEFFQGAKLNFTNGTESTSIQGGERVIII